MRGLDDMTVAEFFRAIQPRDLAYYSPEDNPLGSRRQWNELCRKAAELKWFTCTKIGKRWLAKRESFDRWFELQAAKPEVDPLEELCRAAGVQARRVA